MTSSGAVIRPASPEDAAQIAALADQLRMFQGDETGHLTAARIAADGFGHEPAFRVVVAEKTGSLIGYALFLPAYEPAFGAKGLYLADIFVAEGTRRQGLGRRLVEAVQDAAHRDGRTYVWWVASAKNEAGLAFYRRLDLITATPVVAHAVRVQVV
jgi:ribosomal protein S18 acetylase RimI-like enzyme